MSQRIPNKEQRTKVVRIIARLNTGGPARHVVWLSDGLKDEFETALVCGSVPAGEGDMSYFASQHGVEPFYIPEMSRELSPKDVVSLWKVYRFLVREKPEIIHTHTAKAGTLGRVAGFFYKWLTPAVLIGKPRQVRFVHTYHGHVFHSYYGKAKTRFFLTIEQILSRFATDKIVVLSEQQRREINETFRVGHPQQFKIVRLGIDLSPFQNWRKRRHILREEIGAHDEEVLIGIVGRLTEVKNHSLFLRVAKLWQERNSSTLSKVKFIVIGDGSLRKKLEAEALELQLENTLFIGERNDLQIIYPALDIVALTSFNEGTPLSLIEAMANERAIISTAVGGTVDLLGTPAANQTEKSTFTIAERGILVPSNDEESFLQGLNLLVNNPNLRENLGNNGLEFVCKNYSKERLFADIKSLYKELTIV